MRVLSLLASSTEIVAALGFESHLVGRSHECDFPESVLKLPVVTEPKFPTDGKSYEINERLLEILQEGLSVYRVHADRLAELAPDLIITQTQCKVCAVSQEDVEAAVHTLVGSFPKILSLEPNTLGDIFFGVRKIAEELDCGATGEMLIGSMKSKMAAVSEKASGSGTKPRVACIEWMDPLMSAGNWMPSLVEMAGGEHLFGIAGKHSPKLEWDAVLEADPDILLISPCGFSIEQTMADITAITSRPDYAGLKAVREQRVYVADGNQYFNRPGPRIVESLYILAEIFHPNGFFYGFEGKGWKKLDA